MKIYEQLDENCGSWRGGKFKFIENIEMNVGTFSVYENLDKKDSIQVCVLDNSVFVDKEETSIEEIIKAFEGEEILIFSDICCTIFLKRKEL